MGIDNTTRRMQEDPAEKLLFLAEALGRDGAGGPIAAMEKRGQQQLVNSDRLPSKIQGGSGERTAMEALGFTFGEPDPGDPLFMPAALPAGWKREASDHDMWSYILDGNGRKRVAVFYKAAFYDRKAFMRLETLWSYTWAYLEHGGPLVITGEWATREAVLAAMREHVAEQRENASEFRGHAAEEWRDAANRQEMAKYAAEYDVKAAKFEAAITALEAEVPGA